MNIDNIISAVVSKITNAGLSLGGVYPEDIANNIGQNLPSFVIKIGDEDNFDTNKTGCYFSDIDLTIYIYDNSEYNKAVKMIKLQESIIDLFLADQSLGGTVHCLEPKGAVRGDFTSDTVDYYSEGYYQGLSVGSVSFILNICRS